MPRKTFDQKLTEGIRDELKRRGLAIMPADLNLEQALAKIAELQRSRWQPIDTAPTDNALKLLVLVDGELGIWYRDAYYQEGGSGYQQGLSGWVDQEGVERYDSPTHWMPLPEIPRWLGGSGQV